MLSTTALAAIGIVTLVVVTRSPSATAGSDETPAVDAKASDPTSPPVKPAPRATSTKPTHSAKPVPTATKKKTAADAERELADALAELPGNSSGRLSVAVTDLDDGSGVAHATGTGTYDTASIVKVDILASLLLRHQKAGTRLTAHERTLATAMIEHSDNNSATALWEAVGAKSGFDAANRTLGLTHTSGGAGDLWGLTQTTTGDQLTLLRAVFTAKSPLTAASRDYITGLMHSVATDQRWGVSAADSDHAGFAIKNGWLQRTTTGLWDINSIGEVTHGGHTLLICVLSNGNKSESSGIKRVEGAAKAAAKALLD